MILTGSRRFKGESGPGMNIKIIGRVKKDLAKWLDFDSLCQIKI
jgi:hypothetical protein